MQTPRAGKRARFQFGRNYYQRYYHQRRNPVHTAPQIAHLAQAVDSMCSWWGVKVKSVLDIGAGPGYWRDWYRLNRPKVRVLSTDISDYACERYGHQKKDISKWQPAHPFDLVVCHSVLQYLTDRQAAGAIRNLAAATREVLFLEVPTSGDIKSVLDAGATDLEFHARPREWYLQRLGRHFIQAGAGIWVRRGGNILLYELEGIDA